MALDFCYFNGFTWHERVRGRISNQLQGIQDEDHIFQQYEDIPAERERESIEQSVRSTCTGQT